MNINKETTVTMFYDSTASNTVFVHFCIYTEADKSEIDFEDPKHQKEILKGKRLYRCAETERCHRPDYRKWAKKGELDWLCFSHTDTQYKLVQSWAVPNTDSLEFKTDA